jgi:hypothetical protein
MNCRDTHRFPPPLPVLLFIVFILMLLPAGYAGTSQAGLWETVRRYCLLALLVVTWLLIAACVLGGADLCVHLARRLGLSRNEAVMPGAIDEPGTKIETA